MAKAAFFRHHEALPVPTKWSEDERHFHIRLEQTLDDIYQRFGKIRLKDLDKDLQTDITRKRTLDDLDTDVTDELQRIYDHGGVQSVNGQTGAVSFTINGESADSSGNFDLLNKIYPVGAIYMSVDSASPASIFGGSWERITGRFLLGATGDTAETGTSIQKTASVGPGGQGGEAAHTLSGAESGVPSHTHRVGIGTTNSRLRRGNKSYPSGTSSDSYAPWFGAGYSSIDDVYAQGITSASASTSHNNMPPFLAVYVWKRVA